MRMISATGALTDIVESGARILESACGFCAGYGQAPHSGAISVRTNNRNFEGRSGTKDAQVFLVSPESAVAAALTGKITDPRDLGIAYPVIEQPQTFHVDDSLFIQPTGTATVFRGPTIGKPPKNTPMPQDLKAEVAIKLGDKITTDHIIPAGLASRYRSNIEKSSEFVFRNIDPDFYQRCENLKTKNLSAIILAGWSYGQGSSREHAAICPMYLGVRAVIAKSIERIHKANLINSGIMPLVFASPGDYESIQAGDELKIQNTGRLSEDSEIILTNCTQNKEVLVCHDLTARQVEIVMHGGLLNYTGKK